MKQDSESRVQGLGFRVEGIGFGVSGRAASHSHSKTGKWNLYTLQGLGFRDQCSNRDS